MEFDIPGLQFLRLSPQFAFTKLLVRSLAQSLQWIMTVYAANQTAVISPTVISILGGLVYFFAMLDLLIDLILVRRHGNDGNDDHQ